jgi:P63C domain
VPKVTKIHSKAGEDDKMLQTTHERGEIKILRATHEGIVRVTEDITLPCAVLEDGTRVLTQSQFVKTIGRTGNVKKSMVFLPDRGTTVPVFLSASNIQRFITPKLLEAAQPIPFITQRNRVAIGYRADFLPEVCNVFLDAKDAGELVEQRQRHIADRCRLLLRAYASVGIVALVDEATGYQDVRARDALEKILAKYLTDHRLKWAKTFPDEFYKEIFRLRGWKYSDDPSNTARPAMVGKLTADMIYDRLAPGILERLQKLNPANENGHRSAKHHQWLTSDHGVPELKHHLSGVIALMKASISWKNFYVLLNRAYPRLAGQLHLPLDYDDE